MAPTVLAPDQQNPYLPEGRPKRVRRKMIIEPSTNDHSLVDPPAELQFSQGDDGRNSGKNN